MSDIAEPDPSRVKDVIAYRQAQERNRVAVQTKMRMVIESRNRLHALVLEMLQPNHAHLAEQVHSVCDMGSEDYGIQYYDGVRADAMMMRVIVPPGDKSEEDKTFYKLALETQEKNPLPDNCLKEVCVSKANAYISYIRPNLPYSIADIDAFKHVMPPVLGGAALQAHRPQDVQDAGDARRQDRDR